MDLRWNVGICLLLGLLPGVAHAYPSTIAGLVASSVIAFFMLVAIIVLAIVTLLWNDWNKNRMENKGYRKVPRRWWHFKDMSKSNKEPSLFASEIHIPMRTKQVQHLQNVQYAPASQHTTMNRSRTPVPDAFVFGNHILQNKTYEDKGQTIDFAPEEEPVIETEVLNPTSEPAHVILGQSTRPTGNTSNDLRATHITDQSTYVPVASTSQGFGAYGNSQRAPTNLRNTVTPEAYHVQLVSESDRFGVPASQKGTMDFYDTADGTLGNTRGPQGESLVLF